MTRLAWTAPFLALAACTALAASFLRRDREQPPWDRVRLTWRQRATWYRFRLQFDRDTRRQLAIAWTEEEINRLGKRLREHLGLEGGDT